MIIVKIKGGLGNQLFCYASAYGIAKDNKQELILDKYIYDTNYFLRNYMLDNFNSINNKKLLRYTPSKNKIKQIIYKSIRKILINYIYKAKLIPEKEEFRYQIIKEDSNNLYLDGYWQSYLYFDKYREEIINKFTPNVDLNSKCPNLLKEIENKNSVAIHIRRGDYVTFNGGKCLDIEYYNNAIKQLHNRENSLIEFYVFTDDIDFCKQNFSNVKNIKFIGEEAELTDLEEFALMSKCKNFIIANSSFSWWAAYLASNRDKKVIAPVVDMWKEEFYLPEWIKIKTNLK